MLNGLPKLKRVEVFDMVGVHPVNTKYDETGILLFVQDVKKAVMFYKHYQNHPTLFWNKFPQCREELTHRKIMTKARLHEELKNKSCVKFNDWLLCKIFRVE